MQKNVYLIQYRVLGPSFNGRTAVSKTANGSSTLPGPARINSQTLNSSLVAAKIAQFVPAKIADRAIH